MTTKRHYSELSYDTPHPVHTHEVTHRDAAGAIVITQHYSAEDAENERLFLARGGCEGVVRPVKAGVGRG